MNFIADLGFDVQTRQLSQWVRKIGTPAYLPAFLTLSRRSPYEAVEWLLSEAADEDLIAHTFRGGFETLIHSDFIPSSTASIEASAARLWLQSQYDLALQNPGIPVRTRTRILAILHGRNLTDAPSEMAVTTHDRPTSIDAWALLRSLTGRLGAFRHHSEANRPEEAEKEDDVSILEGIDLQQLRDEVVRG
jgi:hypothetical protein